jgi:predicted peptidase
MVRGVVAIAIALTGLLPFVHGANVAEFLDYSLLASDNSVLMPGRLYVPPGSNVGAARPLILFLHGSGAQGTNNASQLNNNINNLYAEAKRRGAFLLAPQTNGGWDYSLFTDYVTSLVEHALVDYNVDSRRVYVTGLSMGGGGVWNMINRHGDLFAAAVPLCGVQPTVDFTPANLLDEPIWAFHNRNDPTVPVTVSRTVIDSILNAAAEPTPNYPALSNVANALNFDSQTLDLHYWEMPSGGHNVWDFAYARPQMYDWMFAHGQVPEPASYTFLAIFASAMAMYRRSRPAPHHSPLQPANVAKNWLQLVFECAGLVAG